MPDASEPKLVPDYPIRTERLLLRPLEDDDVDDLHAYLSRADVCRYVPFEPRDRAELAEWVRDKRSNTTLTERGGYLGIGVERQDSATLIGDVILMWTDPANHTAEIGYVFNPDHGGQGFATEAARALITLAFDSELDLHRIVARTDARNDASHAVLKRLGMRREAVLVENEWFEGEWTTEIDFAVLRADWPTL